MKTNYLDNIIIVIIAVILLIATIGLSYNQGREDERKTYTQEGCARTFTDDYNAARKPAYIRMRVLKTGTISWCMSPHGEAYQTGDKVKVNLFTHMIVDKDPLANSCILLDSYSPDDSNNQ
jgi:type II secretory pathway pseudopilin PulG